MESEGRSDYICSKYLIWLVLIFRSQWMYLASNYVLPHFFIHWGEKILKFQYCSTNYILFMTERNFSWFLQPLKFSRFNYLYKKNWKLQKCPVVEWISYGIYSHSNENELPRSRPNKMNESPIILSERTQIQDGIYCMILLLLKDLIRNKTNLCYWKSGG